jgi:hypothetical protein
MRLYQAGEKSVGICETCRSKVSTRMEYRDYRPTGWETTVPDVLVAVCDRCDGVVAVPHQSTPKINESRKQKDSARKGIEARVPREIEDALDLIAASLNVDRKIVRAAVLRYYLNLVAEDPAVAKEVKQRSMVRFAGKADGRISIKVPERFWESAWSAARSAGITNSAQLFRGLVILAIDDFQIQTGDSKSASGTRNTKAAKVRNEFLRTLAKTI